MEIKVLGSGFGDERSGMIDSQDGYYSFITLFVPQGPMIPAMYPAWTNSKVKTKFKKLFIDLDGDYLQDGDEPFLTEDDLPLGDYALTINTIYFTDDGDGVYDEGDTVYESVSSNSQTFTQTDEPVIYRLVPKSTPSSQSGSLQFVKIKGLNFGNRQPNSFLHVGGKE
jgi:hypothetical protein